MNYLYINPNDLYYYFYYYQDLFDFELLDSLRFLLLQYYHNLFYHSHKKGNDSNRVDNRNLYKVYN